MRDKRTLPGFQAGLYFSQRDVLTGSDRPPARAEFLLNKGEILMSEKALNSLGNELNAWEVAKNSILLAELIRFYEEKLGKSRDAFDIVTKRKIMREFKSKVMVDE